MTGIELAWWEFEKGFWLLVMFGAGAIALSYIFRIVADIREERRHKKLMDQWAKEDEDAKKKA